MAFLLSELVTAVEAEILTLSPPTGIPIGMVRANVDLYMVSGETYGTIPSVAEVASDLVNRLSKSVPHFDKAYMNAPEQPEVGAVELGSTFMVGVEWNYRTNQHLYFIATNY